MLAIYPWSRLLPAGPEALTVLESCRIGWGVVEAVGDQPAGHRMVEVRQPVLAYDGTLTLTEPEVRTVTDDGFAGVVQPGDTVALHWGRVCDRLSEEEVTELEYWTRWQLDASNPGSRPPRWGPERPHAGGPRPITGVHVGVVVHPDTAPTPQAVSSAESLSRWWNRMSWVIASDSERSPGEVSPSPDGTSPGWSSDDQIAFSI